MDESERGDRGEEQLDLVGTKESVGGVESGVDGEEGGDTEQFEKSPLMRKRVDLISLSFSPGSHESPSRCESISASETV